jgi:hypothetical protein
VLPEPRDTPHSLHRSGLFCIDHIQERFSLFHLVLATQLNAAHNLMKSLNLTTGEIKA